MWQKEKFFNTINTFLFPFLLMAKLNEVIHKSLSGLILEGVTQSILFRKSLYKWGTNWNAKKNRKLRKRMSKKWLPIFLIIYCKNY